MEREISLEEKIKCISMEKKNWKKTTKLTSSYLIKGHFARNDEDRTRYKNRT
jgi:hypothetical protein